MDSIVRYPTFAELQKNSMQNSSAILWLFVLAIPVACISWTFVYETVFREVHFYLVRLSKEGKSMLRRKFFFLFTCEYCFSHYITILIIALTDFRLFLDDWRGYVIAGFSMVWIANFYMNLFALLRQGIKKEKTEIKLLEKETESPVYQPKPELNRGKHTSTSSVRAKKPQRIHRGE